MTWVRCPRVGRRGSTPMVESSSQIIILGNLATQFIEILIDSFYLENNVWGVLFSKKKKSFLYQLYRGLFQICTQNGSTIVPTHMLCQDNSVGGPQDIQPTDCWPGKTLFYIRDAPGAGYPAGQSFLQYIRFMTGYCKPDVQLSMALKNGGFGLANLPSSQGYFVV